MTRTGAALAAGLLAAAFTACGADFFGPTPADAEAFVAEAEARLLALRQDAARAAWARATSPGGADDDAAASAAAALSAAEGELARGAALYDGLDLPEAAARKLALLKTAPPAVAPARPPLAAELDAVLGALKWAYRAGAYCAGAGEDCLDRGALEETVAELRDTDRLLDLWREGRAGASSMRSAYERLVEIANAGAAELGYADAGERWRSAYGRPAAADLPAELDRLWNQARPLYESLHCHVRAALGEEYGTAIAPPGEAIPAHLLGDLGDGRWPGVRGLAAPRTRGRGYDATRALERSGAAPPDLARHGERFFVSLGFEPLPASFRERSLFARPAGRDVLCRARAWNLDGADDVRLSTCLEVTGADFAAVHRELFRVHRRWAHRALDPLFRTGPGTWLPDAAGEAAALSVTPAYLVELDLLDRPPGDAWDVPFLLRRALDEIPALPFALLVDRWRWRVFAGEARPDGYNRAWWDLRRTYQGVRAPAPRSEEDFDPGSARRVASATPAAGDFLAGIARFQIHRALCAAAGDGGPPHRCSIFGSPEAGARLRALTAMGASRPWPDALEAVTGARRLDASALLEYFAPLAAWLDERNAGRSCGW